MKRKSHVVNGMLVLILLLLLGWGGHSWLQPKFPLTVKGDDIVPAPRELEISALSRQVYSNAMMGDVARLNLFRKQRKKYYRPKPPKPKPRIKSAQPKVAVAPPPPPPSPPPPHKQTAPPPELILTGIMLLDDQKIAIFEGTYSEIRGGKLVQNLKPRRRGYKIGESLGNYRIKTIDKSHATLSVIAGSNMTLTISKTPPTQKIQKTGSTLTQKSKPVANNILGKPTPRRTHKSRPMTLQKRPLNKVPPKAGSPRANPPPALSLPPTKSPDSSNPNRLPRLRQRSMGF